MFNLRLDFFRNGKFLELLKLQGEKVICMRKQEQEYMYIQFFSICDRIYVILLDLLDLEY